MPSVSVPYISKATQQSPSPHKTKQNKQQRQQKGRGQKRKEEGRVEKWEKIPK